MRYKIEAEGPEGHWIELVRGEGDLGEARSRARELKARAHNRDVEGWRISEYADANFTDRTGTYEVA